MQCHNLFFIIYDLSAEQSVYTCCIYITYIYTCISIYFGYVDIF
jgi:hypothetical protein